MSPLLEISLDEYHRVFAETDKEQKIKELQRQIDELKNN